MKDRVKLAERIKNCVDGVRRENADRVLNGRHASWPKFYSWVIFNKMNGRIKIGRTLSPGDLVCVKCVGRGKMHSDYKIRY